MRQDWRECARFGWNARVSKAGAKRPEPRPEAGAHLFALQRALRALAVGGGLGQLERWRRIIDSTLGPAERAWAKSDVW